MAKLKISRAPSGLNRYEQYKDWLRLNFFKDFCAYCFLTNPNWTIDHYEPREMSPQKVHAPTNLLPACGACNGRGCKSDYHPRHSKRTKWKTKKFLVFNARLEDAAKLFRLENDGVLLPKAKRGRRHSRAIENIKLLKLDLPSKNEARAEYIEILDALLDAESAMHGTGPKAQLARSQFEKLLQFILSRELFFYVFDKKLNRTLKRRADRQPRHRRAHAIPRRR